ncbi:hypothetical protein EPO15_05865 [bacterium]|nr:MAG: hypothetical protein EPO15_05865 [bacterium]
MRISGMLAALLVLAPAGAKEEPPRPPQEPVKVETPPAAPAWKNKAERRRGEKLALEFAVTQAEVFELRAGKLTWLEVRHVLAIARRSGRPTAEVLKTHAAGLDWKKVALFYGFTLAEAERERPLLLEDDLRDAAGTPRVGERSKVNGGAKGGVKKGPPAPGREEEKR